jgi:methionyl-tRNA formyltransferase
MRIIYCGFSRAGTECLYQLLQNDDVEVENIFVFTHKSDENSNFIEQLQRLRVKYTYKTINESENIVANFNPDYLISVYYRFIISKDILDLVPGKAMNLHPSLLPKYRGTKSSVWAIINEERETGISFHYINQKIDNGKIILKKKILIKDSDTAYSLYHKLISLFAKYFNQAFAALVKGEVGKEQKGETSYYLRELPFDGYRKLSNITYYQASQFIKAMYFPPHKGAIFELNDSSRVEINYLPELEEYKEQMKSS